MTVPGMQMPRPRSTPRRRSAGAARGPRRLPDAAEPRAARRPHARGCGSAPASPTASRSRSPTAGSSWPTADELSPGEITALHYFGRDLVAVPDRGRRRPHWSTPTARTSAPTSASAARSRGECLRCPFHGWRFDGDGALRRDPLRRQTERIPAKARVRTYPDGRAQRDDLGLAPRRGGRAVLRGARGARARRRRRGRRRRCVEFQISTSCQEMAENNARLRPLPVRARHRHDPRGRGDRSTARTSGRRAPASSARLRPRSRRRAGARRRDVPLVDHADRRPTTSTCAGSSPCRGRPARSCSTRWPRASPPASPRTSRSGRTRSTDRTRCSRRARAASPCTATGRASSTATRSTVRRGDQRGLSRRAAPSGGRRRARHELGDHMIETGSAADDAPSRSVAARRWRWSRSSRCSPPAAPAPSRPRRARTTPRRTRSPTRARPSRAGPRHRHRRRDAGWNPHDNQWSQVSSLVGSSMIEPLAALDEDLDPVPWLATSWTPSRPSTRGRSSCARACGSTTARRSTRRR